MNHPTHPDDMTISTLVSHLTGKPLRTFPRNVKNDGTWSNDQRRRLEESPQQERTLEDVAVDDFENNDNYDADEVQSHRRLLWQQKDWGNMREEAIDSLVGYFGSINPGSVGWCAGTEYQEPEKGKGNMRFSCLNGKIPEVSNIPWMNKGNLAYDECH
jgi:hypothetical protein